MINDYHDGRLSNDRNQIFKRAVVVDVDTVGGQLEARPRNPAGSIRARIYSSGMDATLPNAALTIFHPAFPAHVRPPVERDEHVLVFFEDPNNLSNGIWLTTVPVYRDVNFRDPEENRMSQPTTGDRFEGNSAQSTEVNRDIEFGGLSEQNGIREEIIASFESGFVSPFEGKKILHIGDDFVNSSFGTEVGILTQEKGAAQYNSEGREGWGVKAWAEGRLSNSSPARDKLANLISSYSADVVIITLGGNDSRSVNQVQYEDYVARLWGEASSAPLAIWVGPPTPTGRNSRLAGSIGQVANIIRQTIGANFIESRDITNSSGRESDGIRFTQQGGQDWARLIVTRIEGAF